MYYSGYGSGQFSLNAEAFDLRAAGGFVLSELWLLSPAPSHKSNAHMRTGPADSLLFISASAVKSMLGAHRQGGATGGWKPGELW